MTDLQQRQDAMHRVHMQSAMQKLSDTVLHAQIEYELFKDMQKVVVAFITRSLTGHTEEISMSQLSALIQDYIDTRKHIDNITPNGLVVPKAYTVREYDCVIGQYSRVLKFLGLFNNKEIQKFFVAPNVRIKGEKNTPVNALTKKGTEHPHSDAWSGAFSNCATLYIPLLGDWKGNSLNIYNPPDNFKHSWLEYKDSYPEGNEIFRQYTEPPVLASSCGERSAILFDSSVIHNTSRAPDAGFRVSIDASLMLQYPFSKIYGTEPMKQLYCDKEIIEQIEECKLSMIPKNSVGEMCLLPYYHSIGEISFQTL